MSVVAIRHLTQRTMQSGYYCVYCKDNDVVEDSIFGDAICRGCGLVICERMVSLEAEWRNYDGDGNDTSHRARASITNDFDDGALFFSGGTRKERDFLKQVQRQYNTKKEQRIIDCLSDVSELIYKLGLGTQVKDQATELYREAQERGMARQGGSYSGGRVLVAAAIYAACRQTGCARSLKEISLLSEIPMKQISKMSSKMFSKDSVSCDEAREEPSQESRSRSRSESDSLLEEKEEQGTGDSSSGLGPSSKKVKTSPAPSSIGNISTSAQPHITTPADMIYRIGSQVSLGNPVMEVAKGACDKVSKQSLMSSLSPQSVASAIIIFVLHAQTLSIDMKMISASAVCSEANIMKAYAHLRPYVKSIFPKKFVISNATGFKSLPLCLEELTTESGGAKP